jgi:hypothetical protein
MKQCTTFLQKVSFCKFIRNNLRLFSAYRRKKIVIAVALCIVFIYFFLYSFHINAHPTLITSFEVDIYSNKIQIEIKTPIEELESAIQTKLSIENLDQTTTFLTHYFLDHIQIKNQDGTEWKRSLSEGDLSFKILEDQNGSKNIQTFIIYHSPQHKSERIFTIYSDLVQREVLDHQIIIYLRKDWELGIFSDNPKLIGTIRFLSNTFLIDRNESGLWTGFKNTFLLGMRHIAEGYDHLLFLFMLILPAPLSKKKDTKYEYKKPKATGIYLVQVVSAFTIGHSLTLILGAIQIINPPLAIVEVFIAISVLVSAVQVIHPILIKVELWIAGSFGLIHGLAFSSTVSEFGVHSTQLILSILGFNLGIELIQFLVILVSIPIIFLIIKSSTYIIVKNICGIFGIILSSFWIYERIGDLF